MTTQKAKTIIACTKGTNIIVQKSLMNPKFICQDIDTINIDSNDINIIFSLKKFPLLMHFDAIHEPQGQIDAERQFIEFAIQTHYNIKHF